MRVRIAALALCTLPVLASCGLDRSNVAYGTPTSIIVIASDRVWDSLEDSLQTALEPLVFTVREEKAFLVIDKSVAREQYAGRGDGSFVLDAVVADLAA